MTAPPDTTSVQLAFKATSSSNASSNVSATLTDRRNHLLINLNPNMSNFVSAVVHIDSMAQTNTSTLKTFPLRPGQNYIGTTSTVSPTDIRYNFENMTRYSIKIVVLSKEVGTTPSSISSYFSYGTESVTQNLECYNYLFREDGGDNFNNPQIVNIGGIEKNSDIEIDCLLHALYPADIRAPHHVLFTFDEEDKYKDPDSSPPVNTDNSEQLAEYSVYLPYKSGGKYKLTNNLLNNDSVYAVTISGIYSDGQVVSVTVTDRIHVITSPKILEVIAYDPERIDPHPSGEQSSTSTVMNVYLDPASAPIKVKPSDSKITFYLTQNNIIRYKSEVEYTSFVLNDGENEYTVMNDANFTKLAQPESNNHTFSVYAEIKYKNLNGGVDIIKTSNKLTEKFASDIVSLPASGIHLDNAWTASSVTTTVNGTRQVDLADAISYDGYHNAPEFGLVGTLRKTDQYGSGRGNDELFGDLDLVDTHHKFNLSVGEGENQMVSHVKYMYQEQEAKLIRRPGISKQNGVNKIRTEESMVTVRADSKNIISYSTSIPESNSLEEQGWSIVNTGPNTNGATGGAVPKVNLYYFGNTTPAASQTATNSFKLSQANGLGLFAFFNQNQGATQYPFFIVYTTPTGNPADRTVNKANWYKSKVFYGPSSAGGDTTTPNSDRAGLTLLYTGTDDGSLFHDVPASRRVKCEINNLNSNKFDNYADELVNLVSLQTSSVASESQAGSFNFRLLETGLFTSHTEFNNFALTYNAITSAQNDQDKYVDLIKKRPGMLEQNGVNTELTNAAMTGVKADSNTIISNSVDNGWSIVNTGVQTNGALAGKLPKVNLYYFGNTTPAASQTATNSFKLSQVNGLGLFALFNQNQGAKEYPFFIVYTTPTGNPHDRTVNKSWYKSKVFYGPSSAGGDTTTPNSHRAGLTLLYTGTDDGSLFPDVPASRRVKCEINNLNSDKFDNYADELVNSVTLQTSSNASESQAGSFNFRLLETGLFTSHTHFKKFALRYNQPRAKLLYHPNGMFPNIPDKASGVGKYNPGTQQRRILYYIPSSQNNLYSQTDKVKVLIAVLAYNLTHSQHVYTVPDPTASPQKTVVHKINRYTMTLGTASEPNYSGTGNAGKLDIPINNPNDAQNDFYMRAAAFESNLGATITEPLPANSNGGSFNITINNPNQSFRGVNSSGVTYKVFYVVNDPNVSATATINGPISEPYTIQLKDNPTSDNFAITDYSYTTFNNEGKSSFKFKVNFIDGDKTSIDGIRVYFVTDNNNSAVSTHIPSTLLKDVNRVGHVSNNFIEYILQPHGPTGPTSSALNNGVKIIDNELTPSTNTWLNFRSGTINFVPYFTQKANTSNDPNRTDVAEALTGKKINNIPVIDPVDSSSVSLTGGVIQSLTATRIQWSDDNSKYGSVNDVVSATYDVNGQVNNSNLATITLSDNVSTYTNVIKVKITAINDSSVYYSQPITLKFDSVSVDQSAMTISVKRGTNSDVLRTTRGNYSADKLANLNVASLKLVHKKGETEDPTNVDILLYQVQDTVPPTVPPAVQPVGSDSNPNVYDTSSYSLGTVLKLIYRIEAGVKFTINTDDVRDSTPLYLALNSPFQYVVAEKPSLSISPSYKVVDGKMSMGVSIDAKGLHNEGLQGVVFVLAQEGDFTNPNDQDSNGASVTLVFNSSQAIHTYESQGNALQSSSADNMAKMETFIFTDRNGGEWKLTTGDLGPTDKSVIEFPANYGGFHNTKPLLAVGIASTRLGTVATDGFLDITPPLIL